MTEEWLLEHFYCFFVHIEELLSLHLLFYQQLHRDFMVCGQSWIMSFFVVQWNYLMFLMLFGTKYCYIYYILDIRYEIASKALLLKEVHFKEKELSPAVLTCLIKIHKYIPNCATFIYPCQSASWRSTCHYSIARSFLFKPPCSHLLLLQQTNRCLLPSMHV
jgi:hypothetical protein